MRRAVLLVVCVGATATVGTAAPAADRCSMIINFGAAQPSTTMILAQPLPDSADATIGDATWQSMARNMDKRPARTWAQRFRVLAYDQPATEPRPSIVPGDTIQVTPWDYAGDCKRLPWRRTAVWATDSVVVFRLGTARTDTRADAPLTFDVLGGHQPYPTAGIIGIRAGASDRTTWLPARAYYDLVRSLPRVPVTDTRSPDALRAIHDWAAAHPEYGDRFPIPHLLR